MFKYRHINVKGKSVNYDNTSFPFERKLYI